MEIVEEVNAGKSTITADGVWNTVSGASSIVVANGKQIVEFNPATDDKNEIITKVSGRTGNLRAPAIRIGTTYYIGFNAQLYEQIGGL